MNCKYLTLAIPGFEWESLSIAKSGRGDTGGSSVERMCGERGHIWTELSPQLSSSHSSLDLPLTLTSWSSITPGDGEELAA